MSAARAKSKTRRGKRSSPEPRKPERRTWATRLSARRILWLCLGLLGVLAVGSSLYLARGPLHAFAARRELGHARQLLQTHHPDDALSALEEALRSDPALADARGMRGTLELQRGHPEQAFLEFQSQSELEPQNPEGWLGLAQVRSAANQPEDAELAMDRVLELAPQRPGARTLRAEIRYRLGRYQGALLDAEQAVRADATDVRAWSIFIRAVGQTKGLSAASEVGDKALAATGNAPEVQREVASLQAAAPPAAQSGPRLRENAGDHAENWPGALGALMRDLVVKLHEQNWAAAEQLAASAQVLYPQTLMGPWLDGVIELGRGHQAVAEQHFWKAFAASPRSHRVLTNLVAVWWKQRGPRYAGDQLVAINKRDPGFAYALATAARAYLEADQPTLALSTARLGLVEKPNSPIPYRDVAGLSLELDQAGEAVGVCEEGLANFPDDVELSLLKARASLLLGDREAAIQSYEGVLSKHPDQQSAAGALASLLVARGDEPSRQRALAIVHTLELDGPLSADVLGAMGRVYLEVAKDLPQARRYLEVAVQGAPADATLRYDFALALVPGSPQRAVEELRTALSSKRNFPEEVEARHLLEQLSGAGK
jgi:tetratricopeptide (TPR) repeat protein